MIVLAGTVRIAPGKRDAALPPIRAMVDATRAEPGCLEYSFAFDAKDDHLVRIFECYADEAALQAHWNSSHFAAWRAAWPDAGIGERNLMRYAVSERGPV
ncbi:MAG: putative quinol monooxygenase [Hyphomonadaceae bacterium]